MNKLAAPSAGLLRQLNRRLVLNLVRHHGTISRIRLAEATGLSRATVSSVVRALLRGGVLREGAAVPRCGAGRPEIPLRLDTKGYLILAVDIGSLVTRVGVVDLGGAPVRRLAFPTPTARGSARCLDVIARHARRLVASLGPARRRVRAAGVCLPGQVDVGPGVLSAAYALPGWLGVPVRELFERRLSLPVRVENNANAMAVGQALFGAGRGVRNFVLLSVGGGVGAGVYVNGELYRGENGAAGEIGHMRIVDAGAVPCTCGQDGCLETVASARALATLVGAAAREAPGSALAGRAARAGSGLSAAIAGLAEQGDGRAQAVLGEIGRWLGVAAGNLVNVYNPRRLILGGGLAEAGPLLLEPLEKEARRQALPVPGRVVEFVLAEPVADAGLVGAAATVIAEWTSMPRLDYLDYLRGASPRGAEATPRRPEHGAEVPGPPSPGRRPGHGADRPGREGASGGTTSGSTTRAARTRALSRGTPRAGAGSLRAAGRPSARTGRDGP